jgi:hypothetical protein
VTVLNDDIVAPRGIDGALREEPGVEVVINVTGCGILRMRRRRFVDSESDDAGDEVWVDGADAVLELARWELELNDRV